MIPIWYHARQKRSSVTREYVDAITTSEKHVEILAFHRHVSRSWLRRNVIFINKLPAPDALPNASPRMRRHLRVEAGLDPVASPTGVAPPLPGKYLQRVIIREVSSMKELEDAFDVAGGASSEPPFPMTCEDWKFDAIRDAFSADHDVDLIAVEADEIIGAILCFRDEGGVRARLLGVTPQFQGMGVGRALLQGLVSAAGQAGDSRVYLGAVPQAASFYESCGFEPVETINGGATIVVEHLLTDEDPH